jgi:gluconate 2-dehydrogenase gamma chain
MSSPDVSVNEGPEMSQRRELLRRAAWVLGGAISAPAALAILQGCSARDEPPAADWKPKFFQGTQAAVMTALADTIIPRTGTSGALDANVPAFVDSIMAEVYPQDAQERFRAGFAGFEAEARAAAGGKGFLEQDAAQRKASVQKAIETALDGEYEHRPFVLVARELTLLGFFTSRVGITENMEYQANPGAYRGCVPLSQMKKHVYWE